MNSSQKFLILIVMSFMKVCAGSGLNLDIDTLELGETTPPTMYTVPTNTPISRANSEDREIASIFSGADDRDLASELSSSRAKNEVVSATQSSAVRIANRVPTPFFITEEATAISLNAAAQKLPTSCAVIEEENATKLNAVANPQPTDAVSGWSWWYRWLSSFVS